MNAPAQTKSPDYEHAADCLTSLYDATTKLVSTAARGKSYSKSDLLEVSGIVQLVLFLAQATNVDLAGAYVSISGGKPGEFTPDPRWANRALLHISHISLECMRALMASHTATTGQPSVLFLQEAFDRFRVRELYATAMEFAAATGVKVEVQS